MREEKLLKITSIAPVLKYSQIFRKATKAPSNVNISINPELSNSIEITIDIKKRHFIYS